MILCGEDVVNYVNKHENLNKSILGLIVNPNLSKKVKIEVSALCYNYLDNINKENYLKLLRQELPVVILNAISNNLTNNNILLIYMKCLVKILELGEIVKNEDYGVNPVVNEINSAFDFENLAENLKLKPDIIKERLYDIYDILDMNKSDDF